MNIEESKNWIDNASYEELLTKWRFAEAGDDFFKGEVGKYYEQVMKQKKEEGESTDSSFHIKISKRIGFK
jgi:hypothetical protein